MQAITSASPHCTARAARRAIRHRAERAERLAGARTRIEETLGDGETEGS
jgi:hypothetical protein